MPHNITIRDRDDRLIIEFNDIIKFHGYANIAGAAIGFKAMQAAASLLSEQQELSREALSVLTGHPGSGVRDAIEFVTRCHSQQQYTVDTTLSQARWNPYAQLSFSFYVRSQQAQAEIHLKQEVLPHRFFDLMKAVSLHDKVSDHKELDLLKRGIAQKVVATSYSELFDFKVSEL